MQCSLPRTLRPSPTTGVLILGPQQIRSLGNAESDVLRTATDEMGKRSGRAQGLRNAITNWHTIASSGNRLYLALGRDEVRGLLRVGERQLFIQRDPQRGGFQQISPTCVLDFYVHESCQRGGVGRTLFDTMLQHEGLQAHNLGYDRPSNKLIAFCAKHFGLKSYVPQANHFVVFEEYWNSRRGGGGGGGGAHGGSSSAGGPRRGRTSAQRLRDEVHSAVSHMPAGAASAGMAPNPRQTAAFRAASAASAAEEDGGVGGLLFGGSGGMGMGGAYDQQVGAARDDYKRELQLRMQRRPF